MAEPTPDQRADGARRRLVHLAGLSAKTEAAERGILAAAEDRHAAVLSDIASLAPRALLDPDAAERHRKAVEERGHLELIIARSRAILEDAK